MANLEYEVQLINTILEKYKGKQMTTMEIKKAIEKENACEVTNITRLGMALREMLPKRKTYKGIRKYTIYPVNTEGTVLENDIESKITITVRTNHINIVVRDAVGNKRNIVVGKKYL